MTVEEIRERCAALWYDAKKEEKWERCNYEWEFGMKTYNALRDEIEETASKIFISKIEYSQYMGITIRLNLIDHNCLKLWREIQ